MATVRFGRLLVLTACIALAAPAAARDEAGSSVATTSEAPPVDAGQASYYADRFAGGRTANGERYDPRELTAAHRTLPFGARVRVTDPANGRSVVVRINDRGPHLAGRVVDLSRAAAEELGLIRRGVGHVELRLVEEAGVESARS